MVGSGSAAAKKALPTDYRAGRTPFCTVQASWDQVEEAHTEIRGDRPGSDSSPVDRVGYRKSYIAGEPTR
jgi:hypothetical protein